MQEKHQYQFGMIGDISLQRVARVHGEFTSFFKKVASVEELLKLF
ncbi:hypothetical protein [Clostridium beijerinckii]|nr:hypothetical protein [Clostridium beijerinckii]